MRRKWLVFVGLMLSVGCAPTLNDVRKCEQQRDVEGLISALKRGNADVRSEAAEALGDMRDTRAIEPLIHALKDKVWIVRKAATEALRKQGTCAVKPLIAALKDKDSRVREGAAWALGRINDRRAVVPLIAALKNRDLAASPEVAEALGNLNDRRAVVPLIAALRSPHLRASAVGALGKIGDARAVRPLIATLKVEVWEVRERAIEALVAISAVEPLIAALRDKDSRVRGGAARALGKIRDIRAVRPLIAALKDEDSRVREGAAWALGKIKDLRAVVPLMAALNNRDWTTQGEAAKALEEIERPQKRTLANVSSNVREEIERLSSQDPLERGRAAHKLGEMGEKAVAAVPFLIWTIGDNSSLRWVSPLGATVPGSGSPTCVGKEAARAVWKIEGFRAIEILTIALEYGDQDARSNVAGALGEITGENFGQDPAEWKKWWEQKRETFGR